LALAGPPLICHSYSIGNDTSLPWVTDKNSWNNPDPKYNTHNLANDTVKLLNSGMPLLTRMETLRKAAVYSAKDTAAGLDLGSRLMARALTSEAKGESNSIALFDAGYFVESMKQMSLISKVSLFASVDGSDWVKRSVPGLKDKLVAEYALGLMDSEWPNEHIRRAILGAQEGSLLAENPDEVLPEPKPRASEANDDGETGVPVGVRRTASVFSIPTSIPSVIRTPIGS
jgi:hypothetical protein